MFCMNCGKEISDESKVCEYCGTPVEEEPSGGNAETKTEQFSDEQPVNGSEIPFANDTPPHMDPPSGAGSQFQGQGSVPAGGMLPPPEKGKRSSGKKNGLVIALGIVAALLVIAVAAVFAIRFFSAGIGSKKDGAAFPGVYYLSDNELYFSRFNKAEPKRLDDDIYDDWEDMNYTSYSSWFTLSNDGKYIFYCGDVDGGTSALYYVGSTGKTEPVKLASDVNDYRVLKNNKVLYKDNDSSLYLVDFKEKNKIARDVGNFMVDESEKYVLWKDDENTLYVQDLAFKDEKKKLEKDVDFVAEYSDGLKTIVYGKNDSSGNHDYYVMKDLDSKEKIAGNVQAARVQIVKDRVLMYYTKVKSDKDVTYMDLVDDDCESDAQMREPDIDDYTTYEEVDGFWGKEKREVVDDRYYEDRDAYDEKLDRDSLRDELRSETLSVPETTLYLYVEGKEEEKLLTGVIELRGYGLITDSSDNPVVGLIYMDLENMEKVKLSRIYEMISNGDTGGFEDQFEKSIMDNAGCFLLNGSDMAEIEVDGLVDQIGVYKPDQNLLYAVVDPDYGTGSAAPASDASNIGPSLDDAELVSISMNKSSLGKTESISSDEYYEMGVFDDKIYYLTDYKAKDGTGTLWCDKEKIADDVYLYFSAYGDGAGFFYMTDFDVDDHAGTLHLYNGGKSVKVGDDVYMYHNYTGEYTAFLDDYSTKNSVGDLKIFDGKKSVKIAGDVNCIVY